MKCSNCNSVYMSRTPEFDPDGGGETFYCRTCDCYSEQPIKAEIELETEIEIETSSFFMDELRKL